MIEQTRKNAFNLDTILLADFMRIPYRSKTVVDVGTGTGVLMLYLADKTNAQIIGVEIQKEHADLAQKNIAINGLDKRLSVICDDIKNVDLHMVDCVVCNPPFFKVSEHTKKHEDPAVAIARHEIKLTLEDLVKSVSRMLKQGGYFYIIHRPNRLSEIITLFEKYDLIIKRMRFVHPYINKEANHVLIAAMKFGNHGMVLEKPLILYKDKQVYSDAMQIMMEESSCK